jgi:hypothetical protein
MNTIFLLAGSEKHGGQGATLPTAYTFHARVMRGAGRIPAGGFRAPQTGTGMGKTSLFDDVL